MLGTDLGNCLCCFEVSLLGTLLTVVPYNLDISFNGVSVTILPCSEYELVTVSSLLEALNKDPLNKNGRKITSFEIILDQKEAQEAGLREEEIIALQLYTGRGPSLFIRKRKRSSHRSFAQAGKNSVYAAVCFEKSLPGMLDILIGVCFVQTVTP